MNIYSQSLVEIKNKLDKTTFERLLHYTSIDNLQSIVDQEAICSRYEMSQRGIKYQSGCRGGTKALNDHYVYTFATYPFHKTLDVLRQKLGNTLISIAIKKDVLWLPNTCFCNSDATDTGVLEEAKQHIVSRYTNFFTSDGFNPKYANSEILIYQSIPWKMFSRIYVDNTSDKQRVEAIVRGELDVVVDSTLFHFQVAKSA